jgi:hypothetical protein
MSMKSLSRRNFLTQAGGVTATAFVSQLLHSSQSTAAASRTTQINAKGFFTIARRNGRWWFITPTGSGFLSLGVNHMDLAALKHPDNIHLHRNRYGGDTDRFISLYAWAPRIIHRV